MKTEKIFYQDPYIKDFDAVITDIEENERGLFASFDRTAFYPEGGGQPADCGVIVLENGASFDVIDVHEKDGSIRHTLKASSYTQNVSEAGDASLNAPGDASLNAPPASDALSPGMKLHGSINWERRFDHMQQHSGEHIVSGMICSRFNCDNVGFHLGSDTVTIDYNCRITYEQAREIEQASNRYIWENHAFFEMWPDAEELKSIDFRSKKALEGDVRITGFPGADICACCGTHVRSSAEVGLVKIISARNFREGTRLELYCGERAVRYLSKIQQSNKDIAVMLSAKEHETSAAAKKLFEENLRLQSEKTFLEDEYIKLLVKNFCGKGSALVIDESMSPDMGRRLADALAGACPGLCAVFTKGSDDGVYRYALINHSEDISKFSKEMNAALNGKGGGRNGFAQGTVQADKKEIRDYFTARCDTP